VLAHAAKVGKPLVVMEKLDFSRRKQELASTKDKLGQARRSRALSSFAYSGIVQALQSNALLMQVPSLEVNPAYTSVIGRVKYAKPLGVSVHQAAAMTIARRGMGFGEAAPSRPVIPDRRGEHIIIPKRQETRSFRSGRNGVNSFLSRGLKAVPRHRNAQTFLSPFVRSVAHHARAAPAAQGPACPHAFDDGG
jgi:hypothetical protein